MKKLLSAVFVLALVSGFCSTLYADDPMMKGNFLVGASVLSWQSTYGDQYKSSDGKHETVFNIGYAVEPEFMYFVIDDLAIGGQLGYTRDKMGADLDQKSYMIEPKITYYLMVGKIFPFIGIAYVYDKEKFTGFTATATEFPIEIGATYMIGKNTGIYLSVEYAFTSLKNSGTKKGRTLTPELGVRFFF